MSNLNTLLQHPAIWRARQGIEQQPTSVSTGFPSLDTILPGNGWPQEMLIELLAKQQGIGELRLLMPALAKLSKQEQWITFINPPYLPYAPALINQGIDLEQILIVQAETSEDQLWAMEQSLSSGSCSAVLCWNTLNHTKHLRRLQLAASKSDALAFLFRPLQFSEQTSPAHLRLTLSTKPTSGQQGLLLKLIKHPSRWQQNTLQLDIGSPIFHNIEDVSSKNSNTVSVPNTLRFMNMHASDLDTDKTLATDQQAEKNSQTLYKPEHTHSPEPLNSLEPIHKPLNSPEH